MTDIADAILESAERKHKGARRDVKLSEGLKAHLASFPRSLLLKLLQLAIRKARKKGAYFWRAVKAETWHLLATKYRDVND